MQDFSYIVYIVCIIPKLGGRQPEGLCGHGMCFVLSYFEVILAAISACRGAMKTGQRDQQLESGSLL